MGDLMKKGVMMTRSYSMWIVFLSSCGVFIGCDSGGNLIPPEVLVKNEYVIKEKMEKKEIQGLQKKSVFFEDRYTAHGYFVKSDQPVSLHLTPDYPVSQIQCVDQDQHRLWTHSSEDWPSNRVNDMIIHEDEQESLIIVLLDGEDAYYIVFLGEDGQTRRIVKLTGTGIIFPKRFYHLSAFSCQNTLCIAATSGGNGIGIFDSSGKMLTYVKTVAHPISVAGIDMRGNHGQSFFVIFANHMTTTGSSILFVLSEQWDVLYKEVLEAGRWIGRTRGLSGDEFILSTDCWCSIDCQDGEKIWKYSLY